MIKQLHKLDGTVDETGRRFVLSDNEVILPGVSVTVFSHNIARSSSRSKILDVISPDLPEQVLDISNRTFVFLSTQSPSVRS